MRIVFEMDFGSQQTIKELGLMGNNVIVGTSVGLAKGVVLMANRVVSEHLTGQDLRTRSHNLKNATQGWMEAPLDGVVGVRPNSAVEAYKWILGDETKTIVAKKRFLAIPVGRDFMSNARGTTSAGVARFDSPLEFKGDPKYFFFKGKSGGLFFGYKSGKTDRSIKVLFVMKRSVIVVGSGALLAGVQESIDDTTQLITDEIGKRIL